MGSGGPIGSSKAIQVPKSQRNPLKYSNFQKKSVTFFFFFFFFSKSPAECRRHESHVMLQVRSAAGAKRRRAAQARSAGAQRRMCAAPQAQCHLAPLQAARSSWHERSEGHERSPVGVSSRCSCASAGRRERAASEAKQQATVKYIYLYIYVYNYV